MVQSNHEAVCGILSLWCVEFAVCLFCWRCFALLFLLLVFAACFVCRLRCLWRVFVCSVCVRIAVFVYRLRCLRRVFVACVCGVLCVQLSCGCPSVSFGFLRFPSVYCCIVLPCAISYYIHMLIHCVTLCYIVLCSNNHGVQHPNHGALLVDPGAP